MNDSGFNNIRKLLAKGQPPGTCDESGVRRLWWAALDTIQKELLHKTIDCGIWLAAPLPALYEPELVERFKGWVWAPENLERLMPGTCQLPGGNVDQNPPPQFHRLKLEENDGDDPVLLVITPSIQIALALHGSGCKRQLLMRCDPDSLSNALSLLGRKIHHQNPKLARTLQNELEKLGSLKYDSDLSNRFWPRLAETLTHSAPSLTLQSVEDSSYKQEKSPQDLSLLEALTHEVRTPLATIRTLIRSISRRQDLPAVVQKRLRQIDSECSEQIDRFGLIFQAAELQRQPEETALGRTNLESILLSMAPGWSEQLMRRGVILKLDLAGELPEVLSDSRRLEQMLGGLIYHFSRGHPEGSILTLLLQAAGARLKLQLRVTHPKKHYNENLNQANLPERTAQIGTFLSWEPTTGSLQLSHDATRQVMASLGGRYQARRDRDLTIFFPLAPNLDSTTNQ